MAGLFGIGGSAAKTDRKFQLQSMGELSSLFGQQQGYGTSLTNQGISNTNQGANFWQAILSGNPAAMSSALAPQISTITGQAGQQINSLNQFGGRSGGTSAATQNVNQQAVSAIQNLFDQLGPEAAEQLTSIGEFQTGAGLDTLSSAGTTASNLGSLAQGSRNQTLPQQQSQQAAAMQALVTMFTG